MELAEMTAAIARLVARVDGAESLVSANMKTLEVAINAMDRRWCDLSDCNMKTMEAAINAMDRRWGDLSDANVNSLRALSDANQKAIDAAFLASSTAISKAENYNDEWKRNSNEWKDKFTHLQDKMVLETDLERRLSVVDTRIEDIRKTIEPVRSMGDTRAGNDQGKFAVWQVVAVLATLIFAAIAIIADHPWK